MKKKASKIVVTILLALVILYSARNVCLNMFGKTTMGYIVSTTQRDDRDSNNKSERYRNTVSYEFEVSGKKYSGQTSYKTNMPIVRKEDQVKERAVVQFFGFAPYINCLEKYNKNTILNNIFYVGLAIVCLLIIFVVWKDKIKNKQSEEKIDKDNK